MSATDAFRPVAEGRGHSSEQGTLFFAAMQTIIKILNDLVTVHLALAKVFDALGIFPQRPGQLSKIWMLDLGCAT